MKLKKIHIENYKSLVDLEIIEPNPFTVFAGPNGSGKSNIFEAISFFTYLNKYKNSSASDIVELFGGINSVKPRVAGAVAQFKFSLFSDKRGSYEHTLDYGKIQNNGGPAEVVGMTESLLNVLEDNSEIPSEKYLSEFLYNHSRIFINNQNIRRQNIFSALKINEDASNLENVLNRLFENPIIKEEIVEWMELFVPGLEDIQIESSPLSGSKEVFFKEKGLDSFIPKSLISDGTYNILCLLAAVYQSKEPQFLCIEEPENGLNPYVVESLVSFFRNQCKEHGHYIWLNTHSPTLVRELKPNELILVDKKNGVTKIKQFSKDYNIYQLSLDEAWLSNALGGGVTW